MFSGIVEVPGKVIEFVDHGSTFQLILEKPETFDDIQIGDSIAVDGVCLTVSEFNTDQMSFDVGPETLKITGWSSEEKLHPGRLMNLERSLRFGDRLHGHLVSGHVDSRATVRQIKPLGEALWVQIEVPRHLLSYVWKKGSIAVNGVSLTVNEVDGRFVDFCLIPETLKRTNLTFLREGDSVHVEIDYLVRGISRVREAQNELGQ
jgi:riboflavin synthase